MGKTGVLTVEEENAYNDIANRHAEQVQKFNGFIQKLRETGQLGEIERNCKELGLHLNPATGQLSYSKAFQPLALPYDICYVRHGKTEGNTEPRVYQGQVDYPENQLNSTGRRQAEEAADKMEALINPLQGNWTPDVIVYSPLGRAIETGLPFAQKHPNVPSTVVNATAEMAFGVWDNARVIDLPHDSIAHLFYISQNAVVRADAPHIIGRNSREGGFLAPGDRIAAENFVDVLVRLKSALIKIGASDPVKEAAATHPERRPHVLLYGHSMAGAAVSILMGHGKHVALREGQPSILGFDGSCIMQHATPTLLPPKTPVV